MCLLKLLSFSFDKQIQEEKLHCRKPKQGACILGTNLHLVVQV